MAQFKDIAHLYLGCSITDGKSVTDMSAHMFLYGNRIERYKPILRPLSDMTEDELMECVILFYGNRNRDIATQKLRRIKKNVEPKMVTKFGTSIPYSVFGDNDKHIMTGTLSSGSLNGEQFLYILKQGFDLFGLIESGQAINKKTIPNP